MKKRLVSLGTAGHEMPDLATARHFGYLTNDGEHPCTPFAFDANPYSEEIVAADAILELGPGVGRNIPFLIGCTEADWWGVEPNESMRRFFWEQHSSQKGNPRIHLVSSFDEIPDDVLFDVVVSTFCLQHIGEIDVPRGMMDCHDIIADALVRCGPSAVWFLWERGAGWLDGALEAFGIRPDVRINGYSAHPEMNDRGAVDLVIWWGHGAGRKFSAPWVGVDGMVSLVEAGMRREGCVGLDVPPKPGGPHMPGFWRADYYRALRAYCEIFKPDRVCEIGHRFGHSAWAMAQGAGQVVSYDIDLGWQRWEPEEARRGNVDVIGLKDRDSCLEIDWTAYDFIFVDIEHQGPREIALHDRLVEMGYEGFVFWDDVSKHTDDVQRNPAPGMWGFWEHVKQPKRWTHWHNPVGFAVVKYG